MLRAIQPAPEPRRQFDNGVLPTRCGNATHQSRHDGDDLTTAHEGDHRGGAGTTPAQRLVGSALAERPGASLPEAERAVDEPELRAAILPSIPRLPGAHGLDF